MKLVSNYNKIVLQAIGEQEYDSNAKYRLAKHIYMYEDGTNTFLYNNISKRLYLIDQREIDAFKNLENFDIDALEPFVKDWTVVPENFDDFQFANQVSFFHENIVSQYERPVFIVFTTTKCNARCYYCFENGQTRIDMTEETANDVADYIIKNALRKEIYIKWFGGEPLYNHKVIDIICDRLREAGIKYDTNMTTNGYLFDEEMVKKAKEKWLLRTTVITLDGTQDVYNKTKNYIYNDENAFERVINNIELLLKNEIRVAIRLNVGFKNFEDIKTLIGFIKERFSHNEILSIVPIALYDLDGNRSLEEQDMLDAMVEEIEGMVSKGKYRKFTLKIYADFGKRCMAENDTCKVISPRGELGTCEHFSEGEMMYGSIYSDKENLEIKNYFKKHEVLDVCYECPLYVNCGGQGKCPTQTISCDKIHRDRRLRLLRNSIINTYQQYLDNGGQTITE